MTSGLRLADRHAVLAVVLVALAARVIVAVGVAVFVNGTLFLDDRTYIKLAADMARGDTSTWDAYTRWLYDATGTFTIPLTLLFRAFGPVNFLAQVLVAGFGTAAAAVTTRLAMLVLSTRWALVAGLIVALLPSQVMFSSVPLKDAEVWALLASVGLLVGLALRQQGRALAALIAGLGCTLVLLGFLRDHTLMVGLIAALLAFVLIPAPARVVRVVAVLGLLVVVPWLAGIGPLGLRFYQDVGSLEERRENNAVAARTAIVETHEGSKDRRDRPGLAEDAERSVSRDLRHLPRGLSVMLFEPYPWTRPVSGPVAAATAELILWYPLLGLSVVGGVSLLRSRRSLLPTLLAPALIGGAVVVLYGLTEGNFGTAYRHRGEIVWVVAIFAAVGAQTTSSWVRCRRVGGIAAPGGRAR